MTIGETLYIVFPAYNEEANLAELLAAWYPMLELASASSRILLIDDGSRDGSAALLEQLQPLYPQLLVRREQNKGHGPTLRQGYALALEAGADYIFQTDSDLQTRPEDFPDLWLRRGEYAVLAGQRKTRDDGKMRVFVSKVLGALIALSFRVCAPDANVPFRLYDAAVLAALLPLIPEDFALTNALLMAQSYKLHLRHYRKEIHFAARKRGQNSIHFKKIVYLGGRATLAFFKAARVFFAQRKSLAQKLAPSII